MWYANALYVAFSLPIFAIFTTSSPSTVKPRLHRPSHHALKDAHPVPSEWELIGPASKKTKVNLQIGLTHGRPDEVERHLHEVSDPYHHRYRQHLSLADVSKLVRPSKETETLVSAWLLDHGIRNISYSVDRDWINLRLPISVVEIMLDTTYYNYRHLNDGISMIRAPKWSLPLHLHDHIETIHPTNAFIRKRRAPIDRRETFRKPPTGLGENGSPTYEELVKIDKTEMGHMEIPELKDLPTEGFSPQQACNWVATSPLCLRTMYGTIDYVPQAPDKRQVGLVNYLDQINNKSDIEIFLSRYRPDAVGASLEMKTEIVAHGLDQQSPLTNVQAAHTVGLEGNLNAETLLGLVHPIPMTTYNVGGRPPLVESQDDSENTNEPYLEWLQYILAQTDLPSVITTSYADIEQSVPYWYAKRVCQGFAQLGARGVSVLFASGDEGVGVDGTCFSIDGVNKPMFLPTFPASCPYVTAIGATRGYDPEIVAFDARNGFVSGGGFSNYFSRPSYQKEIVDAYIDSLGDLHNGLYNRAGRGYPDISIRGYHYITVWNGTARIIDGTSASSPAAAGIFALVNDALAADGDRPALGWLNPWIYSKGSRGFKDVVVGSNPGCNTTGFPAKKGWDAATGFGTPWFPKLKELALERHFRESRPWYMIPFN